MERELHHIDRLIACRMKGYSQMPSDHIWLMIENRLILENGSVTAKSILKRILEKIRITNS